MDGEVVGDRVQRAQRRILPPQAGMADLEHLLGPAEVLQPVGAEVDQRHPVGQVVPGQVGGRTRAEDLPAVRDGSQPRRADHRPAHVVARVA